MLLPNPKCCYQSKIGTEIRTKIGTEIGTEIRTKIGTEIGTAIKIRNEIRKEQMEKTQSEKKEVNDFSSQKLT